MAKNRPKSATCGHKCPQPKIPAQPDLKGRKKVSLPSSNVLCILVFKMHRKCLLPWPAFRPPVVICINENASTLRPKYIVDWGVM